MIIWRKHMKQLLVLPTILGLAGTGVLNAQLIIGGSLNNGNLDSTYPQEIVPGFFLPKPTIWQNVGFRAVSGAYEDEMSSESWAGPAPTPVTADGVNADDWGVFFKAFSGNATDGAATGRLYQDNPATPGLTYTLTGWAGAEANYMAKRSLFTVEFFDSANAPIGSTELDLVAAGLFVSNGQPFNYKQYSLSGIAPPGAVTVRAGVSMIDGMANPAGGGQAFVVDDFELRAVPEPTVLALSLLGLGAATAIWRRK